ncbi:MarR family transcriptional regulator [uncultured Ferrimonas sp.]|uniref:MarR family winged helix-turn-helix transcriptional regulator n=1 Tax=uncultured Ferrimonas sp. TaxID=432640 RepID=UPI00261C5A1F|nr:MarR family transcriptional regulator [uncultured Ferrimonas sp.]
MAVTHSGDENSRVETVDRLQLDNQVCFPLYSAANAVIRAYRPLLAQLDLTYPQYLVMMLLWQHQQLNVKALGQQLHLDSGTLTPLLKRLESKGFITRRRCSDDERVRLIALTEQGQALHQQAQQVPEQIRCQVKMPTDQLLQLKQLCQSLLQHVDS